jgi:spore coat polysaccharide biosynthesis protein SpsF (cytidylyltransferase family)
VKTVLIVQARMGSSRLPGKVLMDLAGRPMLDRVLRRARRATLLDDAVLATSTLPQDDPVAAQGRSLGVDVFRGDAEDVLDRFRAAAMTRRADTVVRVTADCPLIAPDLIDAVVTAFRKAAPPVDFASNTLRRTYPRGLDVEVATMAALDRAWREADKPAERAHVFPYVYGHPEIFRLENVAGEEDVSAMRWTVDTEDDLRFVRSVYEGFSGDDGMSWREVAGWLKARPEVLALNRHVRQKGMDEG